MNPQDLAALGGMFREAIEQHVFEATKALSASVAEQLAERDARIAELETRKGYDDSHTRGQIENLIGQVTLLSETRPAAYDDADLREQLKALRAEIPVAYDDSDLKGAIVDAEMRLAAAQSKEVEAILVRVKAAQYDDTALRETVDAVTRGLADHAKSFSAELHQLSERPLPPAPRDGTDGRDALHLEVLPAIEEQKSYQRGTYAKHAGGLWRSFEQTSGLRGWECIVNGVKSVDARWEGKTLVESTTLSDGEVFETRKHFAVQVYKGVFVPGSDYEQGDTSTWGGNIWHCNVTGTKALPGDSSGEWTQAVKKGRDGKEVVVLPKAAPQPVPIGGN